MAVASLRYRPYPLGSRPGIGRCAGCPFPRYGREGRAQRFGFTVRLTGLLVVAAPALSVALTVSE